MEGVSEYLLVLVFRVLINQIIEVLFVENLVEVEENSEDHFLHKSTHHVVSTEVYLLAFDVYQSRGEVRLLSHFKAERILSLCGALLLFGRRAYFSAFLQVLVFLLVAELEELYDGSVSAHKLDSRIVDEIQKAHSFQDKKEQKVIVVFVGIFSYQGV